MMAKNGYILMLESNPHDGEMSIYYFNQRNIPVLCLQHSNEVISLLKKRLDDNALLPKLILLSLNPAVTGSVPDTILSVLEHIKSNTDLKHIPVVILGEDTKPDLIKRCYAAGANTFINKPFTNKLTDLKIKSFLQYWFDVAEIAIEKKLQYS